MRCIAHRGFAETYPENTVAAARSATDHVDAVEVDVRRCGSGDLVVIHDETVDRVTDSQGPVAEFTSDELAGMDVLGSGEGVPTLSTVLDAVPSDVELVLDLKEPDIAADAAAVAGGRDAVFSAASPAILRQARDADAGRLAYVTDSDDGAIEVASDLDCGAVHPHWHLCVDEFVEEAHDAGLTVNAWTVPSRHDIGALAHVGVDGVIVDRPEVCPD